MAKAAKKYAYRFKDMREQASITLEELSDSVGISVSQLSRFESGDREPRVSELRWLLQQSSTSGTLRRLDSLSRVLKAKSKKAFRMKTPSYQLTFNDAVNIWLRYWNGEF